MTIWNVLLDGRHKETKWATHHFFGD